MNKRDYYDVLGVSRESSTDEVKKAYRQAALKFHPDRNQGDKEAEERFKEATEAYQILSDPQNRQRYDQFGHAAFANGGAPDFGDFSGFAQDIFGDLFGAFFNVGGAGGGGRVRAGRDLRYNLEITLEEAATGVEREITISRPEPCDECAATGARKGTKPQVCKQCSGTGQIRIQQGFFAISRPCNVCEGQGEVIADPCLECHGSGSVQREAKLSVKIPAGIDHGQRLKMRGEGEGAPRGGVAGDLYVVVAIKRHPIFQRQDTELLCEFPMTYAQATLGGQIEVPTLDGKISLKIPAGTQSGKTFRLKGKGIIDLQTGRRGDQHVRVYVYVPKGVTGREQELLEELSAIERKPVAHENENGKQDRTFFDKVKDFFE